MTAVADRRVSVWQKKINANIKVVGSGSPLVFLHGAGGLRWDPLLEALSVRHTIYAPEHPGTTAGDPDAVGHLDSLWDLVLYYDELLRGLDLKAVPVIGHSFGGMMAAELAANNPERVSKLVLMCPIGLWREDCPIPNWMMITPASDLPKYLLHDPEGPLAKQMFAQPDTEAQIQMIWSMACTGNHLAHSGQRAEKTHSSHPGTDASAVGKTGSPGSSVICAGIRRPHSPRALGND